MSAPKTPPRDLWPPHLFLRGTRFYARLRVPPSVGLKVSHLQTALNTGHYAEAVRRLPVVVRDLRLQLEQHRSPQAKPPRVSVDERAAWWRARIEAAGRLPSEGVPETMLPEWEAELEERLGPVIGADEHAPGRPVHANEEEGVRLAGLVFGKVLPVDAELERFIAEQVRTVRYADRHRRAVARLKAWMLETLGTDDLRRVTRRSAGEFYDHLLNAGVATATANSLTSSLVVYWRWMDRRIGIEGNPWVGQTRRARAGEAVADKRPFTDDEVARLLSGPTYGTLHDLMRIAALSGMRISEIARLTVETSADGVFRVTEGKTASSVREVPIHPDLKRLVDQRRCGKTEDVRLFDELKDSPSRKKEISAKASERFTEYRRKLGIDSRAEGQRQSDVDFHSFRRWFVTKAEMAGQPPHLISAVVGHVEGRKGMTLGTYSGGPSRKQREAVVAAVRLPKGAPVASPGGPIMGRPEAHA